MQRGGDILTAGIMAIIVGVAILLFAVGTVSLMQTIPIMAIGVGLWILMIGLMKGEKTPLYERSKVQTLLWSALIIAGGVVWLMSTVVPELGLVWLSVFLISSGLIIVASYILGKSSGYR
jgi:hypothetical protein